MGECGFDGAFWRRHMLTIMLRGSAGVLSVRYVHLADSFQMIIESSTITDKYVQYGIFQTYYQADFLRDNSPSQISWIGSIQAFLLLFAGPLFGPFYDAGYFRHLCIGGNLLVVFGMMMTRWSRRTD